MSQSFSKYDEEYFTIAMDFSANMLEGETITVGSSSATAYDSSGTDVSATVLDTATLAVTDDTRLGVKVQNGTASESYVIRFKAYITADKYLREDVIMEIRS